MSAPLSADLVLKIQLCLIVKIQLVDACNLDLIRQYIATIVELQHELDAGRAALRAAGGDA